MLFSILLFFLPFKAGIFSKITNRKIFGFFGRYSYSIYVTQSAVILILQRTLWLNTDFVVNHALRCIAVSLLFSFVFSIATYYVIEKPGAILFKKAQKLFFKPERDAASEETRLYSRRIRFQPGVPAAGRAEKKVRKTVFSLPVKPADA